MRKMISAIAAASMVVGLAACSTGDGNGGSGDSEGTVGILMPGVTSVRWQLEADKMEETFADRGYDTVIQFADDDAPTQVSQLEDMITIGVDALIVVAVDGKSLGGPLADADALDIPVLAYTRMLEGTEAVDYYTTFDYTTYGAASGYAILDALGIRSLDGEDLGATGPFNIEIVNGSPTDSVAHDMWAGFEESLQPYVDSGVLQIPSGQTTFEQSAVMNFTAEGAQSRIENLVTAHYSDGTDLDAVWVPFDGMSRGVISGLQSSGLQAGTDRWPFITGGDAEIDSARAILAGEQYSTVFLDVIELADTTAIMVADMLDGNGWPEADGMWNNGVIDVPTQLIDVILVRADNVEEVLVDSGFYTADQVGL